MIRFILILIILQLSLNIYAQFGFEDGTLDAWTGNNGSVSGGIDPLIPNWYQPNTILSGSQTVTDGTAPDQFDQILSSCTPAYNMPTVSPNGGSYSMRLQDYGVMGSNASQIVKTFLVTPQTTNYTYHYAVVLEDPGHGGRPFFRVEITDSNGNLVPCGDYYVNTNQGISGFSATTYSGSIVNSTIWYKDWTTVAVNLTNYIGDNITVKVTAGDCGHGEHFGYAYFDETVSPIELEPISFCPGDPSVTIQAPNGYSSYTWYTGPPQFGQTATINNPQPGDSVVVECVGVLQNCPATITYYFDSLPNSTADYTNSTGCVGDIIQFTDISTLSGNDTIASWQWNFGDGDTSSTQNPTHIYNSSGVFDVSLVVETINGCVDSISHFVDICCQTPPTNFSISGPSCHDSNVVFEYTGAANSSADYIWDFGNGTTVSGNGQGPIEVSFPLGTTNVSVNLEVTEFNILGNPCTASDTIITFTFPSELISTSITNDVLCYGMATGSAALSVSGGIQAYTYQWDTNAGDQTSATANNLEAGTYYFTITDANQCTISNSVLINAPIAMNASINPTNVLCYGDNDGFADLDISGGTFPYTFIWSNNQITEDAVNLYPGAYFVTITDASNCTISTSTNITGVGQPLEATLSTNNLDCNGDTDGAIAVSSSGGTPPYTYQWNNGHVTSAITGLMAGLYAVTVQDLNLCTKIKHIEILEPDQFVISSPSDIYLCKGQNEDISVSATGGVSPYYFQWGTGESSQTINISSTINQIITVSAVDASNCPSNTSTTNVHVYPDLELTAFINEDTICNGESVLISASYAGGMPPYSVSINSQISSMPAIIYPNQSATYNVNITDNCNYTVNSYVSVYVLPSPPINFSSDVLNGCQPLEVHFSESNEHETYTWNFDDINHVNLSAAQNPVHVFEDDGMYSVTLTVINEYGCINSQTINDMITVYPVPYASFESDPEVVSIIKPIIYFNNMSDGAINYYWSFGDGDSSLLDNPHHTFHNVSNYLVTLVAENEFLCRDTVFQTVAIIDEFTFYAPTAFSPDNNGINDYFKIFGHGIDNNNFKLIVYDRWGEPIFESEDINHAWDGRAKQGNDVVQIGTYTWACIFKDDNGVLHEETGRITVIR